MQALRRGDRQVSELCALIGLPQNSVSYHLGLLRQAGLLQVHRSDSDGRVLYYGIVPAALRASITAIADSLQLPLNGLAPLPPAPTTVVFLCTANSARSQPAEAWLRSLSRAVSRCAVPGRSCARSMH